MLISDCDAKIAWPWNLSLVSPTDVLTLHHVCAYGKERFKCLPSALTCIWPFSNGGTWFQLTILHNLRSILGNAARLAHFPYENACVQGSAKARRMPAMIAQAYLVDNLYVRYPGQSTHTHSSCASTTNNETDENAFTLNTLIAPCINKYWVLSVLVTKGAQHTLCNQV